MLNAVMTGHSLPLDADTTLQLHGLARAAARHGEQTTGAMFISDSASTVHALRAFYRLTPAEGRWRWHW